MQDKIANQESRQTHGPAGDPDAGLTVKKALRQRLARQQKAVAAGERGAALEAGEDWIGPAS